MTTILQGNIIQVARELAKAEKQFQMICTSPPYWMLRDYGTPPQHWEDMIYKPMPGLPAIVVPEWTGELGQEPEVNDFIGHLVYCFRELKPVLRDDGTLWVNLGDSYFTTGKTTGIASSSSLEGRKQTDVMPVRMKKKSRLIPNKNRVVGMTPCDMLIKCDPAAGNLMSSKWNKVHHLRKAHCYWIVVRNSARCE